MTAEKGSFNTIPPSSPAKGGHNPQVDTRCSSVFLNTSLLPFFSQINQHSCAFVTDRLLPGLQNQPLAPRAVKVTETAHHGSHSALASVLLKMSGYLLSQGDQIHGDDHGCGKSGSPDTCGDDQVPLS